MEDLTLVTVGLGKTGIFIARLSAGGQQVSQKETAVGCLVHFTLQHKAAEYETLLSKQGTKDSGKQLLQWKMRRQR